MVTAVPARPPGSPKKEFKAALRAALESATGELDALARRGDAGGFVPGGPVTEVRSLKRGMEKLHVADAESAELRVRRELHQLRVEPEAGLGSIGEGVTARALSVVPVGKGRSRQ